MASGKLITLITGANSGIGFECAAQLLAKGKYHVLLGARSIDKGQAAVIELESRNLPGTVSFAHLDVTSDDSIEAVRERIETEFGYLDVLVSNAAVGRPDVEGMREQLRVAVDTNAIGPAVLGYKLEELMKKSTSPMKRIVNVSSGAGSIERMIATDSSRPNPFGRAGNVVSRPFLSDMLWALVADLNSLIAYHTSKAAQNMVAAVQKVDFAGHGIKVFIWNPGFTVSNLGPFNKPEHGAKPTDEATRPLVDIIEGKQDGRENLFLSLDGETYPW